MKFRTLLLLTAAALAVTACANRPKPASVASAPSTAFPPSASADPGARGAASPGAVQVRPGSQEHLAQAAGERVFFAVDSDELDGSAQETLRAQAAWLGRFPEVRALVAGNADERGTREYNLALGARRANAAREYLIAHGVASSRITTISYGKERPFDSRSSEEGWSRNRNAHTQVSSNR
jgi:peptidoglycan-associated lipoprotein